MSEYLRTLALDDPDAERRRRLQVLVLDHYAAFGEEWFEKALIDNWREGKGLLPNDWL